MKWLAALFWLCFAAALWSHSEGNPTAINGVIGAGVCALFCSILIPLDRRRSAYSLTNSS